MTTVRKVARVHRRDATQHLGKAISFIEAAEAELEAGRADAAALCAIHAAIAAADSVTVALAGQRSTDPDHQRAVTLLRSVATPATVQPTAWPALPVGEGCVSARRFR